MKEKNTQQKNHTNENTIQNSTVQRFIINSFDQMSNDPNVISLWLLIHCFIHVF